MKKINEMEKNEYGILSDERDIAEGPVKVGDRQWDIENWEWVDVIDVKRSKKFPNDRSMDICTVKYADDPDNQPPYKIRACRLSNEQIKEKEEMENKEQLNKESCCGKKKGKELNEVAGPNYKEPVKAPLEAVLSEIESAKGSVGKDPVVAVPVEGRIVVYGSSGFHAIDIDQLPGAIKEADEDSDGDMATPEDKKTAEELGIEECGDQEDPGLEQFQVDEEDLDKSEMELFEKITAKFRD